MVGGLIFISCSHSTLGSRVQILNYKMAHIHPIHKGVSLFLLYTNMNKMNGLYHVKEHPKISNFLQFESCSSNTFKVRAI